MYHSVLVYVAIIGKKNYIAKLNVKKISQSLQGPICSCNILKYCLKHTVVFKPFVQKAKVNAWYFFFLGSYSFFKGLVHPKMKISLCFTKVSLRQVMSLGGHLWNTSQACKCSSYPFEWGNIKFSKTVHCLRLNFIFEITKEIWQQLYHKCCFFCSNSVIKSLFLRLDQPVHMCSPKRMSQNADCFYSNWDF